MRSPARLAALAALLATVSLWLVFLDQPLDTAARSGDLYGDVASSQAKFAWNFVIHPPSVHRFWVLGNESVVPSERTWHYGSHPPLWSLLLAGAQRMFGREAIACRLLPLLLGIVSLLLFLALARRTLPGPLPWVALALFATLPVTIRHGTFPNYEPMCQALLLGAWLVYLRGPALGGGTLAALAGLWVVGAWTDVGGHFGPLTVLADVAVFRRDLPRGRRIRFVLASLALFVVLGIGVQVHSALASGEPVSWSRVTGGALQDPPAWRTFVGAMGFHGWHLLYLALPLAAVGIVFALPAALRRGETGTAAPLRPWIAILCAGLGNCLLMRRHALIHDFWLFYTGPAVAVFAALALWWLTAKREGLTALAAAVLCVLQVLAGVALWRNPSGTSVRDFGVALRSCVDGDLGEVALAPFRPGTDRTAGFHARAYVIHFVGRDDPTLHAHFFIQRLEGSPKFLVLTAEELGHEGHREFLEGQFPGIRFEPCAGTFVRADVTQFFP